MNKQILKIGIITLIVVALGFFLYSWKNQAIPKPIPETISEPINNQQALPPEPQARQQQTLLAKGVVEANNLFTIDLYNKYKSEKGNLFFSPYSISSALSMTYEGARGKTAEEMQGVLHLPNDKAKVRSDFMAIYSAINRENKPYQLTTANALWAQQDYPFKQDYFKLVDDYYKGKVTNLNFKRDTENARVTINNWVADKTKDKIKDLIPKGLVSSQTRLVLTNAIYFKADWALKFYAENTRDGNFKLSSGASTTAKMMHQTARFNYGETKDLQILEMNYLGDDLSMLVILPKNNDLTSLEKSISATNLANWKKNMGTEKVQVTLPKFKFETKYLMAKDLKEMGMPTAFNGDSADFTGMWNKQSNENLYISEVIHQTFIEVAEVGTEAAAATAVIMGATSAAPGPAEQLKTFTADHPFIFVIQQKETGNILFIGRVTDPTK